MIIVMKETALNNSAAEVLGREFQFYPKIDLSHVKDETIRIIDLEGDGLFQRLLSGQRFADFLLDKGLPDSVRKIDLLVSDVCPIEQSLFTFASEFKKALLARGKNIPVSITSELNHAITIVSPPDVSNNKWQVFGIAAVHLHDEDLKEATDYAFYQNYPKKKLLWEGEDVSVWLNQAERTFPKA